MMNNCLFQACSVILFKVCIMYVYFYRKTSEQMHAKRSLRYISRTIMGSYHTLYFWETCFFIFMLFYFCSFELGIIEAGTIRNTNTKIKN